MVLSKVYCRQVHTSSKHHSFWLRKKTRYYICTVHSPKYHMDFTHCVFSSVLSELLLYYFSALFLSVFYLELCLLSSIPIPQGCDLMITRSVQFVSLQPENTSKQTNNKSGVICQLVSAACWIMVWIKRAKDLWLCFLQQNPICLQKKSCLIFLV